MNSKKYAVISDIHGNYPALEAILEDSYSQKIDCYIFLGDYTNGLPYANEVVEKIMSLNSEYTICGNHENYLRDLKDRNETEWVYEQFAGIYWNYKELSDKNKNFLFGLDSSKYMKINNTVIRMTHNPTDFFGKTKINEIDGDKYALEMDRKPITHKKYLDNCKDLLFEDSHLINKLHEMEDGIYLFGHFHLQWHLEIENKLLINPGSCGLPGDLDNRSPYTIITFSENSWKVDERKISYDIDKVEFYFKNTKQYHETNIWPLLNIKNMKTGRNQVLSYLEHVEKVAREVGDVKKPYSNDVWRLAASKWNWE